MIISILALLLQVAHQPVVSTPATTFLPHYSCDPDPRIVFSPQLEPGLVRLTGYGINELASIIVVVNRDGEVLDADIERSSSDRKIDSALVRWAKAHVYAARSCGEHDVFRLRIRVGLKGNA